MPKYTNPFIHRRRELETSTVIYVTGGREGFPEWVTEQQYLFEGPRGSGKSSLLRSMEWDVAWQLCPIKVEAPEYIRALFSGKPRHLGVRCRVEEMDTRLWKDWKKEVGSQCAQSYFGTYLEYLLLDLLLSALISILQKDPEFFSKVDTEERLIDDLVQIGFPDPKRRPRLQEQSLWSLRHLIRDQHIAIRALVYGATSGEAMYASYPVLSPGSLVQRFGDSIRDYCDHNQDLRIFPMLDDCNHLADWQKQVVNSAISKAQAPIAYKITTVSTLYKVRKTMDGRPINEQELRTLNISGGTIAQWSYSRRFEYLVQGICRTRIETEYGNNIAQRFDLRKLLGHFDLELLLQKTLSTSEKPEAIQLLEQARKEANENGRNVSITSTWLAQKQVRKWEQYETLDDEPQIQKRFIRRRESIYTRKWNHSAAVAICQDLDLSFPYSGWRTVFHLCIGSIREMLRIMYEMWDIVNLPAEKFVEQENIDCLKQRQAIKRAAEKFRDSLDSEPLFKISDEPNSSATIDSKMFSPNSLRSICYRLGKLFARFQSFPSLIVTPESAALRVYIKELDTEVLSAIDFGVMSGAFLRDEKGEFSTIGLHPMLSPLFNISFRNPFYYPETVNGADFTMLFKGSDTEAEKASARIAASRMERYEGRTGKQGHKPGHAQLRLLE